MHCTRINVCRSIHTGGYGRADIIQARIGPLLPGISMALSQRLEFRQSQALVMTPQLMQAIKLLQLSSLDLAAYVEGELERNPLLERGGEDDRWPPSSRTQRTCRARNRARPIRPIGPGAAPLETSRSSIEQGIGTELENVFPDDGGEKQRHRRRSPRPIRNGRAQAAAERKLQPRGFCLCRDHTCGSSRRADGAGHFQIPRAG